MHTLGSHRVYIHGIHKIKSFVSKGVTCKFARHTIDVNTMGSQSVHSILWLK